MDQLSIEEVVDEYRKSFEDKVAGYKYHRTSRVEGIAEYANAVDLSHTYGNLKLNLLTQKMPAETRKTIIEDETNCVYDYFKTNLDIKLGGIKMGAESSIQYELGDIRTIYVLTGKGIYFKVSLFWV